MKKPRTSNQKRASTRIAIGFVALLFAGWYGNRLFTEHQLANEHFDPVVPGRVNIVGIDAPGYKIIVANRIAEVVQTQGGFGATDSSEGGPTDGSIKKRIPMDELLKAIQGNSKAVGDFVMSMNGMQENDNWPPVHVIWRAEDLRKAFAGDPKLKAKLEGDLNVHIDGSPLPTLRISSLENGIILDYPVTVTVHVNGKDEQVTGRVQEPYKPLFCRNVEAQYQDKQVTTQDILGYYATEAAAAKSEPRLIDNVQKSIDQHISEANAKRLAEPANAILQTAQVVINDTYITSAKVTSYDTTAGKMWDLTIDLNDEGRRRLWKYSHDKVGSMLLVVSDGIPIAAPRIVNDLAEGELTINQMQDVDQLNDAAAILNHQPNGGTS